MLGVSRNLTTSQNKNNPLRWFTVGSILSGEFVNDQFADKNSQLAISYDGNRIAIGAPGNRGTGTLDTQDRGHVRVYQRNNFTQQWTQLGADIDGNANNQHIGLSVAFNADGSRLAVGGSGVTAAGQIVPNGIVRVYRFDVATQAWVQIGADILSTDTATYLGYSVALNNQGNILVVGAPGWSSGYMRGRVHVYKLNDAGTTWTLIQWFRDPDNMGDRNFFGASVAVNGDGNLIAVGQPYYVEFVKRLNAKMQGTYTIFAAEDESGGNSKGTVRIFRMTNEAWVATQDPSPVGTVYGADIPPREVWGIYPITKQDPCRMFGHSIAFDSTGKTLAVGAPGFQARRKDSSENAGIGAVVIYKGTVDGSGNISYEQSSAGKKIIYGIERDLNVDPSVTSSIYPPREFGSSVSLNHDGTVLAAGHPQLRYDDPDPVNASQDSGVVQIYKLIGSEWVLNKTIENPRTTTQERFLYNFGSSCGISKTSDVLGIHAHTLNGSIVADQYRGFTHTYELTSNTYKKVDPSPPSFSLPFGSYYSYSSYVQSSFTQMDDGVHWGLFTAQGTVSYPLPDEENWYGYSVSMSDNGNIVAFGSPRARGLVTPTGAQYGRIDIFGYRSNGTTVGWTSAGVIIPTTETNAWWGSNICLSQDGNAIAVAGKSLAVESVMLFRNYGTNTYNATTLKFDDAWHQYGARVNAFAPSAAGAKTTRNFGIALDLKTTYGNNGNVSGYRLAIGASTDNGNGTNSGSVRLYSITGNLDFNTTRTTTEWSFNQYLYGVAVNAFFGQSLIMSKDGSTLIVGAPGDHTANRGRIYIYEWNSTNNRWDLDVDGYSDSKGCRGDNFGYSVDCNSDGTFIAVGAPNKNVTTATIDAYSPGTVRVYKKFYLQGPSSSILTQIGPDIKGEEIGDCFGVKVSISEDGTTLAVYSEPKKTNKTHYVQIYKYDKIKNIWKQILDRDCTVNQFATKGVSTGPFAQNNALKMSRDGKRVVIGDYQNNYIRWNSVTNAAVTQTNYGRGVTYPLKTPSITTTQLTILPPDGDFIGPPLPP